MDDPTELVVADEVAEESVDDVEEELLIEEISIDGMCGVY
jgi:mycofactocin precursor